LGRDPCIAESDSVYSVASGGNFKWNHARVTIASHAPFVFRFIPFLQGFTMSVKSSKISWSIVASVVLGFTAGSEAGFYISTGQSGSQVQCDAQHTQSWTFHVTQDVPDVLGASLFMKRGSQTTADVVFRINEITMLGDVAIATTLLSVTLHSSALSQQFTNTLFQGPAITLRAGHTYAAVLSSTAVNQQSKAYFVKQDALQWSDAGGSAASSTAQILAGGAPVPSPGACLVLACGMLIKRRRAAA
jgi:hypothetical protein